MTEYFNEYARILVANGFTVTPTKGKIPVIRKWNNQNPTKPEFVDYALKSNRYAGCNVGLVCGRYIALDIDADDPAMAAQLVALAPPTPFQRVGRAPRTLLLYRAADTIASTKIAGCIDVLSGGKQFVAFGIHPDTGNPYQWVGPSPATSTLAEVPATTAAAVLAFAEAVGTMLGRSQAPIALRTADAALKSRQRTRQGDMLSNYDASIKRDANGRVVDGRDSHMAKLTAAEYAKDKHTSPDVLGNRVWAHFIEDTDLRRGKRDNPRQRWSLKDALSKARHICRRKPDLKPPRRSRGGHPASFMHGLRKPGFWTQTQRDRLMTAIGRHITAPAILTVARDMLDTMDMATGFCTTPIAETAKRVSCSKRTVKNARAALSGSGCFIRGPGGVFVPVALNYSQPIDGKGRKAVEVQVSVHPLNHSVSALPALPDLPAALPVLTAPPTLIRRQNDLFNPIVDLDAERYRRGILPAHVVALVRSEMRARGVTQEELAVLLGITQPTLANALACRFGLSPQPAARLLTWLSKAA